MAQAEATFIRQGGGRAAHGSLAPTAACALPLKPPAAAVTKHKDEAGQASTGTLQTSSRPIGIQWGGDPADTLGAPRGAIPTRAKSAEVHMHFSSEPVKGGGLPLPPPRLAGALLQTGWEGGPESCLLLSSRWKALPAAAGSQSALCAARPHLKDADKGSLLCDNVHFKGTSSCRSLLHACVSGRGEEGESKGQRNIFQPGSRPQRLHCQHSQQARTETEGFFPSS